MNEINNQQKSGMAEIFVHFMSFILLGIVATATGILYFQVINKYFTNYQFVYFDASGIHYAVASLIIGFPIYIWALYFWFKSFENLPEKAESRLSKWLTYIVLLIASGLIIGDLIAVVFNFLQGEYGARFLLKALTILIIAGLVFGFYFFERKKIQYKKEIYSNYFILPAIISAVFVVIAIIFGFIVGGTPLEARLRNQDTQRTNNLQELSSCVNSFAYDNGRPPVDLGELKSGVRYTYCASSTTDPETQKEYKYRVVSNNQFELCGEFARSTVNEFPSADYYGKWQRHDKGQICETQTVTFDKQTYPSGKSIPMPAPVN
ncbi:MAG: DUF5671 domain-containing protein [Candidatus Azambacteria bacterium]|nr:DUF5671 domain-containing protein [Candidatus Azambacteria bacterium]